MAEVIWKKLGRGQWQTASAGSKPSGYVHPLALKAIEELDLSSEGLTSKSVDQFVDQPIDLAVTVCDNAADDCPALPHAAQTLHWPFEDPADATGTEAEQFEFFRKVRDQIHAKISAYLADPNNRLASGACGIDFPVQTQVDTLKLIEMALVEDVGAADMDQGVDCTTDAVVPKVANAKAAFVARDDGVVCGVEVAKLALAKFAPNIDLQVEIADGSVVQPQQTIAVMSGSAHDILTIERTCLNFMCRLSGISTLTKQFVERAASPSTAILDTRKTTPGWRRLEKYAVACGGGTNHRMGLYDAIMIKDNHLAFFRSQVSEAKNTIPEAITIAKQWINDRADSLPNGKQTVLQLEVDTLDQLAIALDTECDIILLDNMTCDQLSEAVGMRNERAPKILLEASGGVNIDTINGIAATGVDRISVGALTHSALNFDIGLDWR